MSFSFSPSLVFLGWHKPAVDLIADRLLELEREDADAFRRATVVTLTAPSARRLRERVAEIAGRPILLPRFILPVHLMPPHRQSEPEELAAWVRVLKNLPPNSCTTLLGEHSERMSTERALSIAYRLIRLRDRLEQDASTPKDVLNALPDAANTDIPGWDVLADEENAKWADFSKICELVHSVEEREVPAEFLPRPAAESMLILAALPEHSARLRRQLAEIERTRPGHLRIWVHAPQSEASHFDAWGIPDSTYWGSCPIPIPEASIGDPAEHARAFGDQAVRLASGVPAQDVTLGLCDPSFSSILCTSFMHAQPTNWYLRTSDDLPFISTGAARLPGQLLTFYTTVHKLPNLSDDKTSAQDFPDPSFVEAFAAILCNSVLLHGEEAEERVEPLLDSLFKENLPVSITRLLDLIKIADAECGRYAQRVLNLANACLSEQSLPDALHTIANIVERACPGVSAIPSYVTVMRQLADTVSKGKADVELALLILQQTAEHAVFQAPEKEATSVSTVDWIDLPFTRGKHLILLGLHENCVPEKIGQNGLLSGKLRERLGLPTHQLREARDAYLLTALLNSRAQEGSVHILLAGQTEDGTPIAPSSLLLRCENDKKLADRVIRLFGEKRSVQPEEPYETYTFLPAKKSIAPDALLERVELISLGKPNPYAPGSDRLFSASLIKRFLSCPLRFWLRELHGIDPADSFPDQLRETNPKDYGNIIHAVLYDVGKKFSRLPEGDSEELIRDIESFAAERTRELMVAHYGNHAGSMPTLIKNRMEYMQRSLADFALLHAQDLEDGWRVMTKYCEQSFPVSLRLHDGSIAQLTVKFDRVDFNEKTRQWRVIDYKTSFLPPNEACFNKLQKDSPFSVLMPDIPVLEGARANALLRVWADVQLPLYAYTLKELEKLQNYPILAYYNLPVQKGKEVAYNRLEAINQWSMKQTINSALNCARTVIALIRDGLCLYSAETLGYDNQPFTSFGHLSPDPDPRAVCGLPLLKRPIDIHPPIIL